MNNSKKIGLYFGTFNPIHSGHLMIADYMVEHTAIDQVWFVVSPHNPFKNKKDLLHDSERLFLVQMAIKGREFIHVSDIEFHLPQPSFTIHSLQRLVKNNPLFEFSIIMGEDNLSSFDQWKGYTQILENHQIYVYPRTNVPFSLLGKHKNIHMIDAPMLKISSTQIRADLNNGSNVDEMLPKEVLARIREMNYFID
jgi:nicotinate-nucleotide adenylyltransferase